MRKKLVIGNWKMNGSLALCRSMLPALAKLAVPNVDLVVAPPAVYLAEATRLLAGQWLAVAAQDVSAHVAGSHTGECAVPMLHELGCRYVLVGHSERRNAHGESDAACLAKVKACLAGGLIPVLCVGETGDEREQRRTLAVLQRQLSGLQGLDGLASVVVAYEPVWAIGSGRAAAVRDIAEVHGFIRSLLREYGDRDQACRILYGGSVTTHNAGEILCLQDVDGALVGGASLSVDSFAAIHAQAVASRS